MKINRLFFVLATMLLAYTAQAQVKVGNNPGTIDPSAVLEVESTNKGFLPPRVVLTGLNDATTISAPAKGLVVYNTGSALSEGLYANTGTSAAPVWSIFNFTNTSVGISSAKQRLVTANPSIELNVGDYSFRYSASAAGGMWQIKNNYSSVASVVTFITEFFIQSQGAPQGYYVAAGSGSLTQGTWTNIPNGTTVGSANELNTFRIYDLDSKKTFVFEGILVQDGSVTKEAMYCNVY